MENRKAILISLICFLVSFLLISAYTNVKRNELTAEFGDEVTVVKAAVDIPEYGIITEGMLKVEKVFKNFKQPQTVSDISEIIGKSTYVPIAANEQVTLTKLIHQDGRPVLDRQVEKKMRAVTLSILPHTGVGKLIRPGNRVDIMAAPSYDKEGATLVEVKTMVQNVLVLATGKNIQNEVPTRVNREILSKLEEEVSKNKRKDFFNPNTDTLQTSRPDDNYSYITMQLAPDDAEKILYLTAAYGDRILYLTLRNSTDQSMERIPTTLLDDVLGPDSDYGRSKKRPPPPGPPLKPRFNDIKGGQPVPIY